MRLTPFLLLLIFITSCDKLSFTKKEDLETIDTLVNFTSVDTSPSFKVCDSIFDKALKSDCFRKTIHQKIGSELLKHQFNIKDAINETVYVDLIIDATGKIILDSIQSSENIKKQLPKLDSLIALSIEDLPIIFPAIKKRYKVSTKYQLPIRIFLKD